MRTQPNFRPRQRHAACCLCAFVFVLASGQARGLKEPVFVTPQPGLNGQPTLADFWEGRARFTQDIINTGLPMGESDTQVRPDGTLLSYLHANSGSRVTDSCGAPVPFPGCVVVYKSVDDGHSYLPVTNRCLIPCDSCPCTASGDHIDQQQYPRLAADSNMVYMAYEHGGATYLRRSKDGQLWSAPALVPGTGVRMNSHRPCLSAERVGAHPFAKVGYECLLGGPPGLVVENGRISVLVGEGQNPAHMACISGIGSWPVANFGMCRANPLFTGTLEYGAVNGVGADSNRNFDFRMISAADVQKVGARYYAIYEGVRGPGPRDAGDSQFGLGLARSVKDAIDGPWEVFPGNPIIANLPGNIGLGHGDLVVLRGQTFLYTSLDGWQRGRLALVWR